MRIHERDVTRFKFRHYRLAGDDQPIGISYLCD
jgi:hypothetical protein